MMRSLVLTAALAAGLFALAGCGDAAEDEGPVDTPASAPAYQGPTITISGHTFAFVGGQPVGDAAVGVAEYVNLTTNSDADGRYTLTVPAGAPFTPWVRHDYYEFMYLQTFTTTKELTNVNFQMVAPAVYQVFSDVLAIEPDPSRCQISTTVNTRQIRDLDLAAFNAYGPHGVAGATVTVKPAGPVAVYFNENVMPDRSLTETSIDGGVVWANVEPGTYEFSATHPTTSFEPFVVTCVAGRFINAGPPWGLREQ